MRYHLGLTVVLISLVPGVVIISDPPSAIAQTTNNITVPNNAESTANPQSSLDQQGSLINTQVNTHPLGRSIVGNGLADCTSSGISASAFGSGIGPFDSGTIGGAVTYTHSFGMGTCKQYAKTQLGRAKLETCLLLISNYSKMLKAGVEVSYTELMGLANVECPSVTVRRPTFSSSRDNQPGEIPAQSESRKSQPVESSPTSLTPTQPPQARRQTIETAEPPLRSEYTSNEADSRTAPQVQPQPPRLPITSGSPVEAPIGAVP